MSRIRRRTDPAELAARAIARAVRRAEAFELAAPPRRPMHGHTADCPNRLKGPARTCRFCRAEALGAAHRVNGLEVPSSSVLAGRAASTRVGELLPPEYEIRCLGLLTAADLPARADSPTGPSPELGAEPAVPAQGGRAGELRACTSCYRPTDARDGLCDRCAPKPASAGEEPC